MPRVTNPLQAALARFDENLTERHQRKLHEPDCQNGYDCMFLALVHGLEQELGEHAPKHVTPTSIRRGARSWLVRNRDALVDHNPGRQPTRIKDFQSEYADFLVNDKAWGNHPVLIGALGFLCELFEGIIFHVAVHSIPVLPAQDIEPPRLIRLPIAYERTKGLQMNAYIILLHLCHLPESHYYSTNRLVSRDLAKMANIMKSVNFCGSEPVPSLPSTSTCPLDSTESQMMLPLSALEADTLDVYSKLSAMEDNTPHEGALPLMHHAPMCCAPLCSYALCLLLYTDCCTGT